jgi:hypothetical protein
MKPVDFTLGGTYTYDDRGVPFSLLVINSLVECLYRSNQLSQNLNLIHYFANNIKEYLIPDTVLIDLFGIISNALPLIKQERKCR